MHRIGTLRPSPIRPTSPDAMPSSVIQYREAGLEVNDEENEVPNQTGACDHFDAEEVGCRNCSPVGLRERLPRHSLLPHGIEPIVEKDPLDRVSTDLVAQVLEGSPNSRVTPARVLAGHPDNQRLDFDCGLGTARPSGLAAVVLPSNQLSTPSKKRVWRH